MSRRTVVVTPSWVRDVQRDLARLKKTNLALLDAMDEAFGYLTSFENNADPTADAVVDRFRNAMVKARKVRS